MTTDSEIHDATNSV